MTAPSAPGVGQAPSEPADAAVRTLAEEAFPWIESVHREPWRVQPEGGLRGDLYLWTHLFRCIHGSPSWTTSVDALKADPVVGPAAAGQDMYICLPMGSGGVLQPEVLPFDLIQAAAIELLSCGDDLTLNALADAAVKNLANLRSGICGRSFDGLVLHSFGGIRLNADGGVSTPWGRLVAADRLVRGMWVGEQDSMTAVLAVHEEMTYTTTPPPANPEIWQRHRRIATLISCAVTLGSLPEDPMAAIPLGVGALLPAGPFGSGGEIRFVGLQRRSDALTAEELAEVEAWARALDQIDVGHIEIGLARLTRSVGERNDPADSLVDAVIAWENLVEHSSEATRSVMFGLDALVGTTGRKDRSEAYATRSAIVHGERIDGEKVRRMKTTAVATGVSAFRSLLRDHKDKIALSSEDRVVALGLELRTEGRCRRCGTACASCSST